MVVIILYLFVLDDLLVIIQLCKHVVAKVTLVPCSVNLTGKRDEVGHGEVTINNARIIVITELQLTKCL